ncbi:poly(hydroxyalkanoate) granule-associated protein [Candidatus Gracilibacteria bacterium]|nr:poly(hydroxyalkanoate) granule-associated protein [Candidatus Gracilibacteria bacterium]
MTSEETEIYVKQLEETATATTNQLVELVRKLMLAGVGAMALTRDEAEKLTTMLVARGEIAQKDAEKLMNETAAKLRQTTPTVEAPMNNVKAQVDGLSTQVENSFEQFLNRMNIPSKRDIDDLSAKIAMRSTAPPANMLKTPRMPPCVCSMKRASCSGSMPGIGM